MSQRFPPAHFRGGEGDGLPLEGIIRSQGCIGAEIYWVAFSLLADKPYEDGVLMELTVNLHPSGCQCFAAFSAVFELCYLVFSCVACSSE